MYSLLGQQTGLIPGTQATVFKTTTKPGWFNKFLKLYIVFLPFLSCLFKIQCLLGNCKCFTVFQILANLVLTDSTCV